MLKLYRRLDDLGYLLRSSSGDAASFSIGPCDHFRRYIHVNEGNPVLQQGSWFETNTQYPGNGRQC